MLVDRDICVRQIRVNQGVDVNATKSYAKKSMDRQMPNKMFFSFSVIKAV